MILFIIKNFVQNIAKNRQFEPAKIGVFDAKFLNYEESNNYFPFLYKQSWNLLT